MLTDLLKGESAEQAFNGYDC